MLYAAMYAILIFGSLTMIYPFLLMLSGSTKSAVDLREFRIIPAFLTDDTILYRKHLEGLFNERVDDMNAAYRTDERSFETISPPDKINEKRLTAWRQFLLQHQFPAPYYTCGYIRARVSKTNPLGYRRFRHYVKEHYGPKIEQVNQALGTEFINWNSFFLLPEEFIQRRNIPQDTPFANAFDAFKAQEPEWIRFYFCPSGFYKKLFLKAQYSRDIAQYNKAHGTSYASYDEVHLSRTLPEGTDEEQKDWLTFVRTTLNVLWIRSDESATVPYRDYLRAKYEHVQMLNRHYKTDYATFSDIPLPAQAPSNGLPFRDWIAFLEGWKDIESGKEYRMPAEALSIHSIGFMFRDFLQSRYASIEKLNAEWETAYSDFQEIIPPQRELHYAGFLEHRKFIRREFITRNYRMVLDYLLVNGRGILNTAIYCTLAVLAALLVNPLAAYALSRFNFRSKYRLLLFLMITMAFPPMVTQIPVFLMLRHLNLLNTFAALILPGLANGYSIFLLKGFFDSLPRELYESAQIEGAGEWTMFWMITMSLSKPILSVIALQSFMLAYSNFMFALLICQDQKMWTMMVWLYQLHQTSGQSVVYASLIIAAIPTFIIFALCQKIILRGIVVPVEQ